MTKLEQAYDAIEILKNLGLPVSSEQLDMISTLEKKKIEKDIINSVQRTVEQKTKGMTTAFKLEVFYSPETGVAVNFPQRQISKKRTHVLKITFPDGTVIEEPRVSNTLVKCIRKIGWAEVQDLNIRIAGMNLVVNELHANPTYRRAQVELDDGVYVNTGSNTDVKIEQLKRISKELKQRLKIEKVPINK